MVGNLLLDINLSDLIEKNIGRKELDERLDEGIERKVIPGEQWFRKPENWYAMTSYSNPFKTPYTELSVLIENSKKLKKHLNKTTKVFYGIGTGDTEIVPLLWDIKEHGYTEVVVIDAIKDFIDTFIQSLRNLRYESRETQIMFRGYNTLFEQLTKDDFLFHNSQCKKVTHICLGNTIGNFNQNEIFSIFAKNMKTNDLLLLGVQLNTNPDCLLNQYADNFAFEKLLKESIGRRIMGSRKLVWKYNRSNDSVEAWMGDLLIFRSKKYDIKKLSEFAGKFGLLPLESLTDGRVGVCLFKKNSLTERAGAKNPGVVDCGKVGRLYRG